MGGLSGNSGSSGPHRGRSRAVDAESRENSSDRLMKLTKTIEAQIIPRLLLANRSEPCVARHTESHTTAPVQGNVEELATLALKRETVTALAYIDSMRGRGTTLDDIFLMLLAPAARHLGDLWDNDLRNFAEVAIGLTTLHEILHALSPTFEAESVAVAPGHRALLVPARGETHTFGLLMLEEYFRRGGWDVESNLSGERADFVKTVASRHIDIVGFSLARETGLDDLAADIRVVRRKSMNRRVGIMVGGPAFLDHPERVNDVGADGTAADGHRAVAAANRFVLESTRQQR